MDYASVLPLAVVLSFAFLANLPLGFLREGTARLSFRWFLYIHLSIPFIILLRLAYGFSWRIIPLTIVCAVCGQLMGGRLFRHRNRPS